MYIKSLKLHNWRSHLKTEFTFGKINLIRGPNNSGKSGLAGALEYALTGRMLGTDERGSGADKWLTLGAKGKEAILEAEIAVNKGLQLSLRRTRGASGGQVTMTDGGGFSLTGKQVGEFLDEKGLSSDLLSASLRVGRFLGLSQDGRRELLADLLAPPLIEIPGEVLQDMALVGMTTGGKATTLEQVRALEGYATTARAGCTSALRELGDPAEVKEPDPEAPTSKQCQKKLDSLRMEQNAVIREREARFLAWHTAVQTFQVAQTELPAARERILDKPAEQVLLSAIENETRIAETNGTLSRLRFEIAELNGQIKAAESKAGKCPTCGHEVELEDLLARFKEGIAARRSRIPGFELVANSYEPAHIAREKLRIHRDAVTTVDRLKVVKDPGPEPDLSALDSKIKELEERMQKGQAVVGEIAKHEAAFEAYVDSIAKRAQIETRREAADRVAKWAGPGGVQSEAAGDKFGQFVSAVNEVLHALGYDLQMTPDGFMLVGVFPTGQQRMIEALSESEAWRFSFALQVAIAKVTGIGVVVVDRADMLVGDNRGLFMEAAFNSGIDQVFVFASSAEPLTAAPPEGVKVFELTLDNAGHTQILKG